MQTLYTTLGHWIGPLLMPQALAWLLALAALGWAAWPLARRLFGDGPAAWAAARPLGLMLLVWIAWWIVQLSLNIIPWSGAVLYGVLVPALALSALWRMKRTGGRPRRSERARRAIWISEAIFIATFALALHLRIAGGDIVGQEKFMDLAFLGTLIESPELPPPDPWVHAGTINYYYGGYLLMSAMARLSGASPETAYQLALALVFALGAQLAFVIGWELCRSVRWGLLAVAAVMLAGNLAPPAARLMGAEWTELSAARFNWDRYFWPPSRVIIDRPAEGPGGELITEFPFFSFMVGDLHPHIMALPFVLLLLMMFARGWRMRKRRMGGGWRIVTTGWMLGWLAFINGFDFITMAGLSFLLIIVLEPVRKRGLMGSMAAVGRAGLRWGGVMAIAGAAFLPFHLSYEAPIAWPPVGLSDFRTGVGSFLAVWGAQLAAAMLLVGWGLSRMRRSVTAGALVVLLALAPAAALATLGWTSAALAALLSGGALAALMAGRLGRGERLALALVFFAGLIFVGCEFIYLRDQYGHALQRMNTVFKFYYPCWLLLGLALPVAWRRAARIGNRPRRAVLLALVALPLLAAMEYPAVLGWHRLGPAAGSRANVLDGLGWLRREHPGDWAAIEWLRGHGRPGQVVLEAVGGPYTHHARIATHTPLRAVLGWPNHQHVWRGQWPAQAEADTREIFGAGSMEAILPLLEKYRVDYVYVGRLEREMYPAEGLAKFEAGLPAVYVDAEHRTVIYQAGRTR